MKKYLATKAVFAVLSLFFAINTTLAQEVISMDFFHGRECPHCQEQKAWLPVLETMYPSLVVNEYEVWHDTANQKLWGDRLAEFGMTPSAVPTNIIGEEVIVGFNKDQILTAMAESFGPPVVAEAAVELPEAALESGDSAKKIIFVVVAAIILVGGVLLFSPKGNA